jgi:hypothetical protein
MEIGRIKTPKRYYKKDEEIDNQTINLLDRLTYWETRCKLAEKCLEESPCDPDITSNQIVAHSEYHKFLKENGSGD